MSVVLSYAMQRNPARLLGMAGIEKIGNARDERAFLRSLVSLPSSDLGALCLVAGGFMDGILGRVAPVLDELGRMFPRGVDVFYREHDEMHALSELVALYGLHGRRIVCIGHSWGGSTLARNVLPGRLCRNIPVELLITLDPVGVRRAVSLPCVREWLNVYIPYSRAPWSRENNVARIGMPWGRVAHASRNMVPSVLRHPDAPGMFREFGADAVKRVLQQNCPFAAYPNQGGEAVF